jgi:hypothetical protein
MTVAERSGLLELWDYGLYLRLKHGYIYEFIFYLCYCVSREVFSTDDPFQGILNPSTNLFFLISSQTATAQKGQILKVQTIFINYENQ